MYNCPICLMPLLGWMRESLHYHLDHHDELIEETTELGTTWHFEGGIPFQHGVEWADGETIEQAYARFMFIYGGTSTALSVETTPHYPRRSHD